MADSEQEDDTRPQPSLDDDSDNEAALPKLAIENLQDAYTALQKTGITEALTRLLQNVSENTSKRRTPVLVVPTDIDVRLIPFTCIISSDVANLETTHVAQDSLASLFKAQQVSRRKSNKTFFTIDNSTTAHGKPTHVYIVAPFNHKVAEKEGNFRNSQCIQKNYKFALR